MRNMRTHEIVSAFKEFKVNSNTLDIERDLVHLFYSMYNDLKPIQRGIIVDGAMHKIIQGVRQSGKSYLLKKIALINAFLTFDKTIYVASNKHTSSKAFCDDLEEMYMNIPSQMKPSVTSWTRDGVHFDNGSRILTGLSKCCYTCDLNIDLLLMDEAAFYNESDVSEFWYSNYPCLSNKEIIIASTRSSRSKRNFFWRTWLEAGVKNDFQKFTITNKDIPKRDSKWVKEMKAIIGENQYYKEYIIKNS